ncbi:MAG TPA: TIGR03936 family radical SAM-associated protein [Spirochaetia bacterium]|nr:TIGR03936 family radical SAM-associated protein [Spirochaetia bacterium]
MRLIDPARDLAGILQSVQKPARYVGGEYGSVVKDGAALSVAISYPDLYEIGMSNNAVRILYNLLNRLPDVQCERVFAPAPDFEERLRGAGVPLYSLESGRAVRDFDIVGFSIGYELTFTNALAILDCGGVTLEPARRGERDPIVLVGGPAASNPVPYGVFADCIFIGEAEGWAEQAFSEMAALKRRGASRSDLLDSLRSDASIWHPGRTEKVRRALWRGFATRFADACFPVPSMRVVQDHGTVEIMRGCPNACKFCHATVYYRACRRKGPGLIAREVDHLVKQGGYRQVTLSSLSSGDYGGIQELVRNLNARHAPQLVSFALPSLRVDSVSLQLFAEISEVRKSGLTFAVETARDDWQKEVRKKAGLDKVIEILREARAQGWRAAKFYFMVGLPASFEADEASEIISFLQSVRSATGMFLNVNVAGFIPKPHTPYQRARQIGEEMALERIMAVKAGLRETGFKVGYHAPFLSILEGIVSRGDTRAGDLVLDAFRRGARLDAWEEHIKTDLWRDTINAAGWDVLGETCRARTSEEELPWDVVALGLSQSRVADAVPESGSASPAGDSTVATRPEAAAFAEPPSLIPLGWVRVIFTFSKTDRAVFISHLDLMTVMERALARAGYRPRFTEGFNPKPRLEFASPLGLGIASREEVACIDLHDFDSGPSFVARLSRVLPPGIKALQAAVVPPPEPLAPRRSLMSACWGAEYEISGQPGDTQVIRLKASEPSIRKTMEAAGTWGRARAARTRTFARGKADQPVSYFEAFCGPSKASSDLT